MNKLEDKLSKIKGSKGFTLIELIVVIGIIGILVGIASPRFNGFSAKARFAAVQQDIKVLEDASSLYHLENNDWPYIVNSDGTRQIVTGEKADALKVKIGLSPEEHLYSISEPKLAQNTKAKETLKSESDNGGPGYIGYLKYKYEDYVMVTDGKLAGHVFQLEDAIGSDSIFGKDEEPEDDGETSPEAPNPEPEAPSPEPEAPSPEPEPEPGIEDPAVVPPGYELANDDDFEYVVDKNAPHIYENEEKGYYKYVGTKTKVALPHKVKGNLLKDTYKMFYKNSIVTAVSNDNPNIVHTGDMFRELKGTNIDVSKLDTSNVVNMSGMFRFLQTTGKLDLSTLNTSKVTDISYMFQSAQITEAHLKNMDTSNVKDMTWAFGHSLIDNIDLNGWKTTNVTNFNQMFTFSKATVINTRSFTNDGPPKYYNSMFSSSNVEKVDLRRMMNPVGSRAIRNMFGGMRAKNVYIHTRTVGHWDANKPNSAVGGGGSDGSTANDVQFIVKEWFEPL